MVEKPLKFKQSSRDGVQSGEKRERQHVRTTNRPRSLDLGDGSRSERAANGVRSVMLVPTTIYCTFDTRWEYPCARCWLIARAVQNNLRQVQVWCCCLLLSSDTHVPYRITPSSIITFVSSSKLLAIPSVLLLIAPPRRQQNTLSDEGPARYGKCTTRRESPPISLILCRCYYHTTWWCHMLRTPSMYVQCMVSR